MEIVSEESVLNLSNTYEKDVSIDEIQYSAFYPNEGSPLNDAGTITINIPKDGTCYLMNDSFISLKGNLFKKAGNNVRYTEDAAITFTNNGLMHCFQQLTYSISNKVIETSNFPGISKTVQDILILPKDFPDTAGLSEGYFPDDKAVFADNTGIIARKKFMINNCADKVGKFDVNIPLSHIFGFCRDFQQIIPNRKHTLELIRTTDDDAIYRTVGDAAKIVFSSIVLYVKNIEPNIQHKTDIMEDIDHKRVATAGFRTVKTISTMMPSNSTVFTWNCATVRGSKAPDYMGFFFQENLLGDQTKNNSIFSDGKIIDIWVEYGNQKFPTNHKLQSLTGNNYFWWFHEANLFAEKFYGINRNVTQTYLNPLAFKGYYPFYVFDTHYKHAGLVNGDVQIAVQMKMSANLAANYKVYCMMFTNTLIEIPIGQESVTFL